MQMVAEEGLRPWQLGHAKYGFPSDLVVPQSMRDLLEHCWENLPEDRPSFIDVLDVFERDVLVDCAVFSRVGRKIWKKYFVDPSLGLNEEVANLVRLSLLSLTRPRCRGRTLSVVSWENF